LHKPELMKSEQPHDESAFDAPDKGSDKASGEAHKEEATHDHHVVVATDYAAGTATRLRIFAVAFAIVLVGAFFFVNHVKGREEAQLSATTTERAAQPPPVEVVEIERTAGEQNLVLPGAVHGWYASTIYARVNGYVASWVADIGDRVKKDQVLATIDTPDLDAQLEASQAQLKASDAEVKVKEANADFAKTTYERWQGSPRGVVSDQEREDKKAQYAVSIAQLNAARARVNLDQANVDRLTFLTRFKRVTAPYDGVITDRHVDIGDLVTAGSTANTSSLYGIAQSEEVRVFVDVPQVASAEVKDGTPAQVMTSEYPNRPFDGKVTRTSKSIDPKARTLRVEVDLPNEDLALTPGMYVQVSFHLNSTGFVQVPASALLFRASGPQVALVSDGAVKFRDVTIGRDNGNFVELASGVAPGDKVALNISNQIADGDRVTVRDDARTAAAR